MTFICSYFSMLWSGGDHSSAVSYARNMVAAKKQQKRLAQWRRARITSIETPFE